MSIDAASATTRIHVPATERRGGRGRARLWLIAALVASLVFGALGLVDGRDLGAGAAPFTLALDPETGRLFVGTWNDGTIVTIDPQGERSEILASGHRPITLAWSAARQTLFFGCFARDHVCALRPLEPSRPVQCFCPDEGSPDARPWRECSGAHPAFLTSAGRFGGRVQGLIASPSGAELWVATGHVASGTGFHKDFQWLSSVAPEPNGLVVRAGLDLVGRYHDDAALPAIDDPSAPAFLLLRPFAATLLRVSPTSAIEAQARVGRLPIAVAASERRRSIFVGDEFEASLFELDAASLVLRARRPTRQPLTGLWMDDDGDRLLAVSRPADVVLALDPATGSELARVPVHKPSAGVLDPRRRALWVASLDDGDVHRIDLGGPTAPTLIEAAPRPAIARRRWSRLVP